MIKDPAELPLRDIQLPAPVSWWPPAPGWWALAVLSLAAVMLTLVLRHRRARARSTLHALALAQLQALRRRYEAQPDPQGLIRALSELLRRICVSLYPRRESAALTGEAWLHLLDQTLGDGRFSQGPGRALLDAPYRPAPQVDVQALLALSEEWVRALPKTPIAEVSR
jgi:hypothetical protein